MVNVELMPDLRLDNEELFRRFPSGKVFLVGNRGARSLEQLFKTAWGKAGQRTQGKRLFRPDYVTRVGQRQQLADRMECFCEPAIRGSNEVLASPQRRGTVRSSGSQVDV